MAQPDINKLTSINSSHYVGKDWDVGRANVWIDGIAPDIYAQTGNLVTCNWTTDNAQFVTDPMGNAIRTINHNGQADITLNISRMSNIYQNILDSARSGYNLAMHSIIVNDDAELLWTKDATLGRRPQITLANSAPTASVVFHCAYVDAKGNNDANEENGNNNYQQ